MKPISQTVTRIARAMPRWSPQRGSAPIGFGVDDFGTQVAELRVEIMSVGVLIPFAVIAWSTVLARLIFTRGQVTWAPILVGMAIILGCGVCLWLKRPSTYRIALWLCAVGAVLVSIFHWQAEPNAVGLMWMAAACVIVTLLVGASAGWLSVIGLTTWLLWQSMTGASAISLAEALSFLLATGSLVWLAQTVERVLLRTLRWVGDGYDKANLPQGLLADIHVVHRNAQHLLKLVNDILDLSQMDANHMAIMREPVRVDEFITGSLQDFADLMRARQLSLTLDIASDLPDVYADRTRIRQVLLNLVANALRFTDQGGLTICAHVASGVDEANQLSNNGAPQAASHVVIAVSDTGIGIEPDDLKRIFEPFTQVDGSLQRKHSGTGLGLTISKQFVELHGGQMWVTSAPGAGSTFSFSLPLHVPAPERYLDRAWGPMRRREMGAIAVVEEGTMLTRVLQRSFEGIAFFRAPSLDVLFSDGANPCPEAIVINAFDADQGRATLPAAWPPEWQRVPVLHCHVPGPEVYLRHRLVKRFLTKPITQEQFNAAIAELLAARCEGLDASGQPPTRQVARILLVEDDEDALHLLSRLLRAVPDEFRAGFVMLSPMEVSTGAQALDVLQSTDGGMLDGVILDLGLGAVSGQDILNVMSDHPLLSALPVCIVSGQLLGAETLVASHLTLTKKPGLTSKELIQAMRALLPIVLPGFKPLLQEDSAG